MEFPNKTTPLEDIEIAMDGHDAHTELESKIVRNARPVLDNTLGYEPLAPLL